MRFTSLLLCIHCLVQIGFNQNQRKPQCLCGFCRLLSYYTIFLYSSNYSSCFHIYKNSLSHFVGEGFHPLPPNEMKPYRMAQRPSPYTKFSNCVVIVCQQKKNIPKTKNQHEKVKLIFKNRNFFTSFFFKMFSVIICAD